MCIRDRVPITGNHTDKFSSIIQQQPIQIGGNASIGYGFSSITTIPIQALKSQPV